MLLVGRAAPATSRARELTLCLCCAAPFSAGINPRLWLTRIRCCRAARRPFPRADCLPCISPCESRGGRLRLCRAPRNPVALCCCSLVCLLVLVCSIERIRTTTAVLDSATLEAAASSGSCFDHASHSLSLCVSVVSCSRRLVIPATEFVALVQLVLVGRSVQRAHTYYTTHAAPMDALYTHSAHSASSASRLCVPLLMCVSASCLLSHRGDRVD